MTRPPPYGAPVPGNRWDLVDPAPVQRSVTVVVTHYEQPNALARTLHALERQTYPPELVEIVVADDGSSLAPEVPAGVRLVRQEDRGFRAAAARNLGAAAGTGEVLVFLDADTTPEPGFLAAVTALPGRSPEVVVVGRRRHADLGGVGVTVPIEEAGPAHELEEPSWLREGYAGSGDLLHADDSSYRFVISAVLSCSRWLFEETGGFDETFTSYGGEDWEWTQRAWSHGAVLAHESRAVAWHDGPDWAARRAPADGPRVSAKLAENLGVARRSITPGSAPTGLHLGPAGLAVTFADDLAPTSLLVTADSLLQALPHTHLHANAGQADLLAPDPRVRQRPHSLDGYRLHLHVLRGVHGPTEAWQVWAATMRTAGTPGVSVLLSSDGRPLARLVLLRAARRQERWGRDDLFATAEVSDLALDAVPGDLTFEHYLGTQAR